MDELEYMSEEDEEAYRVWYATEEEYYLKVKDE